MTVFERKKVLIPGGRMYTGQLYLTNGDPVEDPDTTENKTFTSLQHAFLAQAWVFGDRRGIPGMQNAALDTLHQRSVETWRCPSEAVQIAYGNTIFSSSAKLREYLVELFVTVGIINLRNEPKVRNIDFLLELGERYGSLRSDPIVGSRQDYWMNLDLCRFHIHSDRDCKGRAMSKSNEGP